MNFCGAVLCGGASRRMGQDKARLAIDGTPMAVRVADALRRAGASSIVAIGGDVPGLRAVGLTVVPDDEPGAGPFAATITAVRTATAPIVLVASCDLLAPDPDAMRATVAALEAAGGDVAGAVPLVDGHRQWVHAAWRREALAHLHSARADGVGSLKRAAAVISVIEVAGIPVTAVADADSPADLPDRGRRVSPLAPRGTLGPMDVPEIDVAELAERRAAGALLIDVRTDDEFAKARVPGALHIPLGEVAERVDEVPTEGTVYVICARGPRSAKAVQHYRAQGIDAVNVAGGTVAWIDAGQPIEGAGKGTGAA